MIPRGLSAALAALVVALPLVQLVSTIPVARAAQLEWPWCHSDVPAPDDDLESAAVGLTESELTARYGAGEDVQDGTHYQRDGYVLVARGCDIVVEIAPDSPYGDPEAAHALVRTLLPADAILVGFWGLGDVLGGVPPQDAEEWISGALASRYRLLGEPRTGSILAVYYFVKKDDPNQPIQYDAVDRIELRSAQLPRVLATPTAP